MTEPLFRPEAHEHQRVSWLGRISLAQPPSFFAVGALALTIALAVLAFLCTFEYTRKARVAGQLMPSGGIVSVAAPSAGTLLERRAREGDAVARGDTLAIVSGELASSALGDTQAAIRARLEARRAGLLAEIENQNELAREQRTSLARRIATLREMLAQAEAELGTQRDRATLAERSLARMDDLRTKGHVSQIQLEQQQAAALDQQVKLRSTERALLTTRAELDALEQQRAEAPLHAQSRRSALSDELARLDQELAENAARREVEIRSPRDGVVATVLLQPGQSVTAGQPLLTIVPSDSTLRAQLLVPSRAVGFVDAGDDVSIRYAAYPYQKFGHHPARVASVSRTALTPAEVAALAGHASSSEPMYRLDVELAHQSVRAYGRDEPLRAGMLLEADIVLDNRRLIEWVLEPVYSVRGR